MRHLAALVLLATAATLSALDVGQQAPSLAKVTWMKGSPVEPGKTVTVVEFWATWCGPCKTSIPHLTELQKKYGDKVNIVGISNEDQATVKPFVANMGEKMDYHVGIADVATYSSYMEGIDGIPHAFVVDGSGLVVWQGHPATMGATLEQVVAGTFDAKTASAIAKAHGELEQLLKGRNPDIDRALKKIAEILALDPVNEQAISIRLAIGKFKEDHELIRETLTAIPLKQLPAEFANSLAFSRATEEDLASRHLDVALTLIDHALALEPDNAAFIDTKARIMYNIGLLDQAIALQQKAIAKDPKHDGLSATLAYYVELKKLAASVAGGNAPAPSPAPATRPTVVP